MNESIKKLLSWVITKPVWVKVLSVIVIMILTIMVLFSATSCGASKSTVRVYNRADSTTTTISVSNGDGGSTTVNVEPKIKIDSTKIF